VFLVDDVLVTDDFAACLMVATAIRFAASTIFFWLAPTSTLTPTRRFYHFLLVGADIYADADTPLSIIFFWLARRHRPGRCFVSWRRAANRR